MRRNALSVLVVEPEASIADALCAALERRGHQARIASDSEGAMEQETPDVLICGVDGDEGPVAGQVGVALIAARPVHASRRRCITLLSPRRCFAFDILARVRRSAGAQHAHHQGKGRES